MPALRRAYHRTPMLRRIRASEKPVSMATMPVWFVGVTDVRGGRMMVVDVGIGEVVARRIVSVDCGTQSKIMLCFRGVHDCIVYGLICWFFGVAASPLGTPVVGDAFSKVAGAIYVGDGNTMF